MVGLRLRHLVGAAAWLAEAWERLRWLKPVNETALGVQQGETSNAQLSAFWDRLRPRLAGRGREVWQAAMLCCCSVARVSLPFTGTR